MPKIELAALEVQMINPEEAEKRRLEINKRYNALIQSETMRSAEAIKQINLKKGRA